MADSSTYKQYVETYTDSLRLLAQQQPSRFRNAVSVQSVKGEGVAFLETIAPSEAQEVTTRYADKVNIEQTHNRRWAHPRKFEWGAMVEDLDKLKMNIELNGPYTRQGNFAINRTIDDELVSKFFATSLIGRSGGDSVAFPTGTNVVAVTEGAGAATGMNVDKLLAAREIILGNEVDIDDPMNKMYCAISAAQERNLLEQVKIVNKDYQDQAVLSGGGTSLKEWFGINFILTERLDVDSNSYRRNPFWCMSGMGLGIWRDVTTDVVQNTTITGNPFHVTVNAVFGATRLEEEKVVEIKCSEA
jgi:hypothetical protein